MFAEPGVAVNPTLLGSLDLAFVGDGVYELLVREHLAARGAVPVKELHRMAVAHVCARAQSQAMERLLPLLTPQEEAIYKRGRNASGTRPPKNTDQGDYRRATGLEALFGWLYLSGDISRVRQLFARTLEAEGPRGGGEEPDHE